ncbi:hypothetical protein EJB05_10827, partial [Eragrostis curvula]
MERTKQNRRDKIKVESSMRRMEPKTLVKRDLENKVKVVSEGDWDFDCTDEEDETEAIPEPRRRESMEEREARREERRKENLKKFGSDYQTCLASQFHRDWDFVWSHGYGSFEDTTRIPPMRYTDKPAPGYRATTSHTLQIFSVMVAEIKGGLQWPLDVFGLVAVCDNVDHNRNIIFQRTRDSCQILTEEGTTQSEDEDLSFLAVPFICNNSLYSRLLNCAYTSKSSTLEFALASIVSSVEATIFARVISGAWPDGFHGQFAVFTAGTCDEDAGSIDCKEIVLRGSRGEEVLVTDDGMVQLSRRVVSVESKGKLKAWRPDNSSVVKREKVLAPLRRGSSHWTLHIGSCKMEVSVAWSLISSEPVRANSVL